MNRSNHNNSNIAHSLKLGNLQFDSNLIQGPLAGYSCAAFRKLIWPFGGLAFATTEMISCNALIHNPNQSKKRFTYKDPSEGPLCYQLSARTPEALGRVTTDLTEMGADLIDLNCGCPVQKIRQKGAGSKLLAQPLLLEKLISAMRENTDVPISIKIRVDGRSSETCNKDIVNVVNNSGLDFITVHGRHWKDRYDIDCNYDEIAFFANEINIPVIGNGDICDLDSLQKMMSTGVDGAMICRAGLGRPWVFQELTALANGETFEKPNDNDIIKLFLTHVEELIELVASEKIAVLQSRNFSKYYLRQLNDGFNMAKILEAIHVCESFEGLQNIVAR